MNGRVWSSLLLLLIAVLCHVNGVHVFDVYRMIQYEKLGTPYGSQRSSLNLLATIDLKTKKASKYIAVMPFERVTKETILGEPGSNRSAAALLVILPSQISDTDSARLEQLEVDIIPHKVDFPVWFTYKTSEVEKFYNELKVEGQKKADQTSAPQNLFSDSYKLSVPVSAPTVMKDVSGHNIQGWLSGRARAESIPTIAIVSNYDSFGAIPELAKGGSSGTVALLELARLFSKLYSGIKSKGGYNLLFLLTGAGRMNFVGTKQWLSNADSSLLKSIDFVLCIDDIGKSEKLHLHVSRSAAKDSKSHAKKKTHNIYKTFKTVSQHLDVPLKIVHKKINISSSDVPWQHERFSRKKILSMTLSGEDSPRPHMTRSNTYGHVKNELLVRDIKFIAESLSRIVFDLGLIDISVFSGQFAVSNFYVSSWTKTLSGYSRMMPYLATDDKKVIANGLEKELAIHLADVNKKAFQVPSDYPYLFYGAMKGTMSAYHGKPVLFDIVLSLSILLYCLFLYGALKGPKQMWIETKQLFQKNGKKR